jgi:hypothetical protein
MKGEVDPGCKGCDSARQPGPVIDAQSNSQVIGEIRIGDHTFNQSDDRTEVLQHAIANLVICSVCRENHHFLKYPTPFKKFLELFSTKTSSEISRGAVTDESMDGSAEPKQLLP